MSEFNDTAKAFVQMAHEIVWCSVATIDKKGRPRSRVLHPIWELKGEDLIGWIATGPTPIKKAHLNVSAYVSCNYWASNQDTCVAECHASWVEDLEGKQNIWDKFVNGPAPVGYDPSIIPGWESAGSENFAGLRLDPWRLRVMPGSVMMSGSGTVLTWKDNND
jgi:hypothetical protein